MSLDRALALVDAAGPVGYPNPTVGAVVVAGGAIVGEGVTEAYGGRHGEVVALAAAGDRARGATLYVTMEPCAHHGRTPPCVDAILAAGVARVVAGCLDPNPEAAGGLERLRAAGRRGRARRPLRGAAAERGVAHLEVARRARSSPTRPRSRSTAASRCRAARWVTGEASRRLVHELARRARCGRGRDGDGARGCAAARRARCPGHAAAAQARLRPGAAAAGSELELRSGRARGGARRARGRGRAVDPARGRADARDGVPRGRARRQAAPLRRADALGRRAALPRRALVSRGRCSMPRRGRSATTCSSRRTSASRRRCAAR